MTDFTYTDFDHTNSELLDYENDYDTEDETTENIRNKRPRIIDNSKESLIIEYFRKGNLNYIKDFILENPDFDLSFNDEYLFLITCEKGYLNIAKYLLKIKPNINIRIANDYSFNSSCSNGHLEFAKWLLTLDPTIGIIKSDNLVLIRVIHNGFLNVAKWLYSMNPNIDLSINNEELFKRACINGHLNISKWLLSIKPNININIDDDMIYTNSIGNGHINIAKWLLSINPQFNNIKNNAIGFRLCCEREKLCGAKYLYKLNNYNMLAKEVVLEDAYKAQKYLVCEWLLSIYDEWDLNFLDNDCYSDRRSSYYWNDQRIELLFERYKRKWLQTKIINEDNKECSICYDTKQKYCIVTPCKHFFCIECINKWLLRKKSCPNCRSNI